MKYKKKTDRPYLAKIDFVFFNRRRIEKAVREARADKGKKNYNGSGVSDPVAAVVLNNLSPLLFVYIDGRRLENPETWLNLIDLVYRNVSDIGKSLLDSRYVRCESSVASYMRADISQSTFSRMWKKIEHLQELYAVQLGLIRVL